MLLGVSRIVLVAMALVLAACASAPVEQRTTQGPTAEQIWLYRVITQNGREPTFEERGHWRDEMDRAISRHLVEHPEVANAPNVTSFRFLRQVTSGMTKEQVTILLAAPDSKTTDAAEMEKLAGKFGEQLRGRADEVWSYPLGWRLFFSGDRIVDITQFIRRGPDKEASQ
jgi:hypothetical protein